MSIEDKRGCVSDAGLTDWLRQSSVACSVLAPSVLWTRIVFNQRDVRRSAATFIRLPAYYLLLLGMGLPANATALFFDAMRLNGRAKAYNIDLTLPPGMATALLERSHSTYSVCLSMSSKQLGATGGKCWHKCSISMEDKICWRQARNRVSHIAPLVIPT